MRTNTEYSTEKIHLHNYEFSIGFCVNDGLNTYFEKFHNWLSKMQIIGSSNDLIDRVARLWFWRVHRSCIYLQRI